MEKVNYCYVMGGKGLRKGMNYSLLCNPIRSVGPPNKPKKEKSIHFLSSLTSQKHSNLIRNLDEPLH